MLRPRHQHSAAHLFPAGGQRGAKVAVTVSGTFTWPVKVWSPGVEVAVGSDSGKLEITIPADLPADRVWLRLYAEGGTATTPFLVGNLLEQNEQEPNNASRSAPKVDAVGLTINRAAWKTVTSIASLSNCRLVKPWWRRVDAQARLGSPMDAVLQVATPAGIVLAENHDDVQLDPRLAFTAKVAGVYVVRLFAFSSTPDTSVSFHGGANYIYRLTLTTGPYITHATPLAVSSTQPATVDVFGWNIPAGTKIPVTPLGCGRLAEHQEFVPPGDLRSPSEVRLGLVSDRAMANGPGTRVAVAPRSCRSQTALADSAAAALALPTSITGRIMTPRQVDKYRVSLKKGQTVILAAESRDDSICRSIRCCN